MLCYSRCCGRVCYVCTLGIRVYMYVLHFQLLSFLLRISSLSLPVPLVNSVTQPLVIIIIPLLRIPPFFVRRCTYGTSILLCWFILLRISILFPSFLFPPRLPHRLHNPLILLILPLIPLHIILIRNLLNLPPIPIRFVDQRFPFL